MPLSLSLSLSVRVCVCVCVCVCACVRACVRASDRQTKRKTGKERKKACRADSANATHRQQHSKRFNKYSKAQSKPTLEATRGKPQPSFPQTIHRQSGRTKYQGPKPLHFSIHPTPMSHLQRLRVCIEQTHYSARFY